MAYPITKRILHILSKIFIEKVDGEENLPKEGFIISSNHESYIDSLVLAEIVLKKTNKKVHYIAVPRLFRNKIRKIIWTGWAGCIPA